MGSGSNAANDLKKLGDFMRPKELTEFYTNEDQSPASEALKNKKAADDNAQTLTTSQNLGRKVAKGNRGWQAD